MVVFSATLFGQKKTTAWAVFDFEQPSTSWWDVELYRDTINNVSCVWQTGRPQKQFLDSAYSLSNVIITDTVNAYPVNDTSAFIVAQRVWLGWPLGIYIGIDGMYSVDADTLLDYGMIEVSVNNGSSWINILTDTQYHFLDSACAISAIVPELPVLTGNSGGWKHFAFSFCTLADSFNFQPWNDTVLIRFSFISDSVQTGSDGLMFDNIQLIDWWEGVEETGKVYSKATPNPASDILTITTPHSYSRLFARITDMLGRVVLERHLLPGDPVTFRIGSFLPGTYHYQLRFDDGKAISTGLFIKQ